MWRAWGVTLYAENDEIFIKQFVRPNGEIKLWNHSKHTQTALKHYFEQIWSNSENHQFVRKMPKWWPKKKNPRKNPKVKWSLRKSKLVWKWRSIVDVKEDFPESLTLFICYFKFQKNFIILKAGSSSGKSDRRWHKGLHALSAIPFCPWDVLVPTAMRALSELWCRQ